jgi:hypothetical protein
VKKMANKAAKNISSEESQTMVPTLTMFGRPAIWTACLSAAVVLTTRAIMSVAAAVAQRTPGWLLRCRRGGCRSALT